MELYSRIRQARFLSRPNRFIAMCEVDGEAVPCHVKNTGRLRELLLPGCPVWLEESDLPTRKTRYDLVCVDTGAYPVNIDSQAPNRLFAEWAAAGIPGLQALRPETVYSDSRFDFAYERLAEGRLIRGFVEVKGVTLFDAQGVARFPDAPTERGVKHLHGLMEAVRSGYEASVCFVAQRTDVACVRPNDAAHAAFGQALRQAGQAGVALRAFQCSVWPGGCRITDEIPALTD